MTQSVIFLPVLANIFLVIMLYVLLGQRKKQASQAKTVDDFRRALHSDAWPEAVQQVNNCIRNQFELPVLFYVLCFMFWSLNAVTIWVLVLAWVFVILRYYHAFVHTGSNYLPLRRRLFTFAALAILGLWLLAAAGWFMVG